MNNAGSADRARLNAPLGAAAPSETPPAPRVGAILAAACALPGVAAAEGAPTEGIVGFKYLYYQDSQPSLKRVEVKSPSAYALIPLGPDYSFEGSFVADILSGATPRYHTSVSSASRMTEDRRAGDVKITRYFRRAAFGVGLAASSEHDYKSTAGSFDLRLSSDDNNTTVAFGAGLSDDKIDSTGGAVVGERKRVADVLFGVTQVLSPKDIAKFNLTYSRGRGYYSDPYKLVDNRPRKRDATAALLSWNHSFSGMDATLRSSYRYYHDTFEINAHTFGFEWAQGLPAGFVLTPSLRYYTQSSAYFYFDPVYDPVLGEPFPPGFASDPNRFVSADQRLSAFGAVTAGLKVAKTFARLWSADVSYDYYQQRGEWRIGGEGSPGLEPFRAYFIQFGLTRRF